MKFIKLIKSAESIDYILAHPANYSIADKVRATKTQEDYDKVYNDYQKSIKDDDELCKMYKSYKEYRDEYKEHITSPRYQLKLYNNLISNNRLKKRIQIKD